MIAQIFISQSVVVGLSIALWDSVGLAIVWLASVGTQTHVCGFPHWRGGASSCYAPAPLTLMAHVYQLGIENMNVIL